MKIALASDHAGFELKEKIKSYLEKKYIAYSDFGTFDTNSIDYPDYIKKAAWAVSNGEFDRGIFVCGSGVGASIVANKIPGIRAALCMDEYTAEFSRKHNNTNVIVFAGRRKTMEDVERYLNIWLKTEFDNGRHQIRIDKIRNIELFEIFPINSYTDLYCIIGNPVKHSFSPKMHNAAFRYLGINATYVAFTVEQENLEFALKGIKALGIKGVSVTIPYKVVSLNYLDEIDELANKIGAINTIINNNGKLIGTNTDCFGFYKALKEKTSIENKNIAIFGSGGASRAICFSLFHFDNPNKLYILTRIEDRNERNNLKNDLIKKMNINSEKVLDMDFQEWYNIKDSVDIIINATPLGMEPDFESSILKEHEIPENIVVMDIVYNPTETKLIQYAKNKNCIIVYGINMLLYQGARQFELWTGYQAPIEIMRAAVESSLKQY